MRGAVHIATSLDGFIARSDGSIDWLDTVEDGNEDYGFYAFLDSVDALLMGRNTYDVVLGFGAWPYGDKPVFVATHRSLEPNRDTVEPIAGTPAEIAATFDDRGIERVYVDGGETIRAFLDAGLIERMSITTIPVLIGNGIPLFTGVSRDISLRLVDSLAYTNGLVQSTYDVI